MVLDGEYRFGDECWCVMMNDGVHRGKGQIVVRNSGVWCRMLLIDDERWRLMINYGKCQCWIE